MLGRGGGVADTKKLLSLKMLDGAGIKKLLKLKYERALST